jgi:hypothetical protein
MSAGFVVAAVARRDGSESDGIHVLWTLLRRPAGRSTAGTSNAWARSARAALPAATETELLALHKVLRLELPGFGEIRLRQADCPGGMAALPDEPVKDRPKGAGRSTPKEAAGTVKGGVAKAAGIVAAAASAIGISTGPRKCAAYHVRLDTRHRIVQVRAGLPSALAIALREGKAVDALVLSHPSGTQTARFENRDVDEVLVYCSVRATSFEVCVEDARDPREEEAAWAGAEFVAKNLQLPLRTLDGSLADESNEQALAKSRLFNDEVFDPEPFKPLAALMNEVAADAKEAAPSGRAPSRARSSRTPFVSAHVVHALALLVGPTWRRMLGFAVLDKEGGLRWGPVHYRVTGRFLPMSRAATASAVPRGRRRCRGGCARASRCAPQTASSSGDRCSPPTPSSLGPAGIAIDGNPGLTIVPAPVSASCSSSMGRVPATARRPPTLPGCRSSSRGRSRHSAACSWTSRTGPAIRLKGTGSLRPRGAVAPAHHDDIVTRSVVLSDVSSDAGLPPPLELGTVRPPAAGAAGTSAPPAALGFCCTGCRRRPERAVRAVAGTPVPPAVRVVRLQHRAPRVDTNGSSSRSRTRAHSRSARGAPPPIRRPSVRGDLELLPENQPAQARCRRSCRSTTCWSRPTATGRRPAACTSTGSSRSTRSAGPRRARATDRSSGSRSASRRRSRPAPLATLTP